MKNNDYEYTDDDMYLPDNFWNELRFIVYMLKYICKHPNDRKVEWYNLRRQINMYLFWQDSELKKIISHNFVYKKLVITKLVNFEVEKLNMKIR